MPESEPKLSGSHLSVASLSVSSIDLLPDSQCDPAYKVGTQAALPFDDVTNRLTPLDTTWSEISLYGVGDLENEYPTFDYDKVSWPVADLDPGPKTFCRSLSAGSKTNERSVLECFSTLRSPNTFLVDERGRDEVPRFVWGEMTPDLESSGHDCPECPESFCRAFELEEHAKISRHKPFSCKQCDQTFSRRDAWTRHRKLHQARGGHPCPHCDKYQGRNAFKRKDHLRKHLLKVHQDTDYPKRCPFSTCKLSSPYGSFNHFERRKDYTRHMREDHGDRI